MALHFINLSLRDGEEVQFFFIRLPLEPDPLVREGIVAYSGDPHPGDIALHVFHHPPTTYIEIAMTFVSKLHPALVTVALLEFLFRQPCGQVGHIHPAADGVYGIACTHGHAVADVDGSIRVSG